MAVRALKIGHEVLDSQHAELFAKVAALAEHCRTGPQVAEVTVIFADLVNALETHFLIEEALLREAGFSAWEQHAVIHRELVAEWKHRVAVLERGASIHPMAVVQQFEDLLFSHELLADNEFWLHLKGEKPELAPWSDELLVGHAEVDGQHQALVNHFHHLYHLAKGGTGRDEMVAALHGFGDAVHFHFRCEERLFADRDDPQSAQHRQIHASLGEAFVAAVGDLESGRVTAAGLIRDFVAPWLVDHVRHVDAPHLRQLGGSRKDDPAKDDWPKPIA